MSGTTGVDSGALVGRVLRRLLFAALVAAVLFVVLGPLAVVLAGVAVVAWLVWAQGGGNLPVLGALPAPGWAAAGLVLLALALLASGFGVVLLLMVGLALVAVGAIGPARLHAIWLVLRGIWALGAWLATDTRAKFVVLADLARLARAAVGDAAVACAPGGVVRQPLDELKAGLDSRTVPAVSARQDGSVKLKDLHGHEVDLKKWEITTDPHAPLPGVDLADAVLTEAGGQLQTVSVRLQALTGGLDLVVEALDAAVAALPTAQGST